MISDRVRDFATSNEYKTIREPLQPSFASISEFRLLKEKEGEFTYRMVSREGTRFWVFRVQDGKMATLSWGDE